MMKRPFPLSDLAVLLGLALWTPCLQAADLSAGGYHSLHINAGQVEGLGDGTYGQLGATLSGTPVTVAGLSGVSDIAAGGFSSVALKSDGTVWLLGETTIQHTTPHGTPSALFSPVPVTGLSGIDAIAAGHRHYLALDTDTGQLYGWGHNGHGQVGDGGLLDVVTPVLVATNVAAISAGDGFSLAVKTDGTLWSWGRNAHGQLGQGDTVDRATPTQVGGVTSAVQVEAGGQHALVLLSDGSLLAMGNNDFGQLGVGNTTSLSSPTPIPGLSGVTMISAGYFHSGCLDSGHQVSLWGRNHEGQCGGGSSSPVTYSSPQLLTGLPTAADQISCGYHFTLFKLSDSSIAACGSNSDGQLDGSSVADQDVSPKILSPQLIPLAPIPNDLTAPVPNPMSFALAPVEQSPLSVTMTATTATDISGVEYYFESLTAGGNDSGWQDSPTYTDTGLALNTTYSYRVRARDKSSNQNTTAYSAAAVVTTASTIQIVNHSFEDDENTSSTGAFSSGSRGGFGGQLTGWISQSGGTGDVAVGWKDITAAELHPNPSVGGQESQALSLITGSSVLNTTGLAWSSLKVGDELTLTIALGMRSVAAGLNWNENTFFGLTDGGANLSTIELSDTVAHSGIITNNPSTGTQSGDGSFSDVSFTHEVVASDLMRSGQLGILIYSQGTGGSGGAAFNQSFFDNVRLEIVSNDYSSYISNPSFGLASSDQGINDDPDGDGIDNAIEAWFGTDPSVQNEGVCLSSVSDSLVSFTHSVNPNPPSDLSGSYEWSENLEDWYACGSGPAGGASVNFTTSDSGNTRTVQAIAGGSLNKFFFRIKVSQHQ